jgi:hypothetical protein
VIIGGLVTSVFLKVVRIISKSSNQSRNSTLHESVKANSV